MLYVFDLAMHICAELMLLRWLYIIVSCVRTDVGEIGSCRGVFSHYLRTAGFVDRTGVEQREGIARRSNLMHIVLCKFLFEGDAKLFRLYASRVQSSRNWERKL